MLASEARRLSSIYSKINNLLKTIEVACKKGHFTISVGLLTEGEHNELKKLGYQIKTVTDDDGDLRETWISW